MRSAMAIVTLLFFSTLGYGATYTIPQDFATIQDAIDNCAHYDTLIVKPGIYTENIDFKGKAVTLKSEQGPVLTIIDGGQAGSVVTCKSGEMADTELEGFTLRNGKALDGGGMFNDGSSPRVTQCVFFKNSADAKGGGMCNVNASSPILLECVFKENDAMTLGGGMCNLNSSSPKATQCDFKQNSAERGSGIYNDSSSPAIIQCEFSGNTATLYGGGICNYYSSSPKVEKCLFQGNSVATGGGIFNSVSSSPEVFQCVFQGNTGGTNGGGMYNESTSSPVVVQCVFQGNSVGNDGGGMFNHASSDPVVTQCVFFGNSAAKIGGGIRNLNQSSPTVINCILWSNAPYEIYGCNPIVAYCCIQGGYPGPTNISSNPCFNDPANQDFHLLNSSPCIDAGYNKAPNLPAHDFDGDPRKIDGDGDGVAVVDMGVDESPLRPSQVWVDDDWVGMNVNDPVGGGRLFGKDAFDNIMDGINAVVINGEVHVADGEYKGPNNRDMHFNGRALTLKSENGPMNCVIDCENSGYAFEFYQQEGSDSRVEGFTIKNGAGTEGGGMYIINASPTVKSCIFQGNTADRGAGIYNYYASPFITHCTFQGNTAPLYGGGIYNYYYSSPKISYCTFQDNSVASGGGIFNSIHCSPEVLQCVFQGNVAATNGGGIYNESVSSPTVTQCLFQGNSAGHEGGGIFNHAKSQPVVTQCTFYGNAAVNCGGGMRNYQESGATVINTILWSDTPEEIAIDSTSSADVTFSCVQGGYGGTGNIPYNPLFSDPANNDFHLTCGSPCKNKGDDIAPNLPTVDFEGDPRISYGAVDMGVDEFHPHMYYTGDATPGGMVAIHFVGIPGDGVRLFLGAGVLPTPLPTMYGDWYLQFPILLDLMLGLVPSPDGILKFSSPVPIDFPAPLDLHFQSGIGVTLSNLCVMKIKQ